MTKPGPAFLLLPLIALVFSSCATTSSHTTKKADKLVVSVNDQRLVVMDEGRPVKSYPISTSKFGLGSRPGSNHTPLGSMYVYQKVGGGARPGTVFKSRKPTGEVIRPNAPGRDPIVSRILWLEGKEASNSNTKERTIYIHGTAEERSIGRPASYGCIRMTSRDVIDLYDRIGVGTDVYVKRNHLDTVEIPGTDRTLMAAARSRESRSLNAWPSGDTEILAAAAASARRSTVSRPPAPKPTPKPKVATKTKPAEQSAPVRRGAFTPRNS